jgi:hypothetical protein
MKGLEYIKISLAALVLAFSGVAQSGAYAKFDNSGELIGLFNLSGKDASCSDAHRLSGTVRNIKAGVREQDIDFSFLLVSGGRRLFVGFSLRNGIVPRTDIEKLLLSNGKGKIAVSACLIGGRWTAKEITRQ